MVVVFANQKGGVGKSAVCLNLGFMLGGLIVDIDPQSTITRATVGEVGKSMVEVLQGESIEGVIVDLREGVRLAPAAVGLANMELLLVSRIGRESVLKKALKGHTKVWVDTPPSLGLLSVNALVAADKVVIPVQPQYTDLLGLKLFLDTLETIRKELNPRLDYRILITFFDGRLNHHKSAFKALGKLPRFDTVISRSVRMAESLGQGIPMVEFAPGHKVTQEFIDLSKEVEKWLKK